MVRKSARTLVGVIMLLTACRPLAAQGDVAESRAADKAERRIDSILDGLLRTPLDYQEMPLTNVLLTLQEEYAIPFQIDRRVFEALAIDPDVKVSLTIRGVTLRSALELLLASAEGIDYVIDHEAVVITSIEEAASRMVTRVYRIRDLASMRGTRHPTSGAVSWADFDPLMDVITSCIEPRSWDENGTGEGDINVLPPGMYVIRQTNRIHRQIEQLLADIRRCKADIERDAAGAKVAPPPREDDPFGDF